MFSLNLWQIKGQSSLESLKIVNRWNLKKQIKIKIDQTKINIKKAYDEIHTISIYVH